MDRKRERERDEGLQDGDVNTTRKAIYVKDKFSLGKEKRSEANAEG